MDDRAQHGYRHLTEMISFEGILTVFFVQAVNTTEVVDSASLFACYEVVLQRNVYVLYWNLGSALLYISKEVPGQEYVIMSEVAGLTVDKLYGNALYMLSEYYGDGVLLLYPWDKA
jgi:hypothetical protein